MINLTTFSNRCGIPRFATTSNVVNSADVTYNVNSIFPYKNNYSGLILIKIGQSIISGTTTTLPIKIAFTNGTYDVTTVGDSSYTVADVEVGIHLAYFEDNTIQLIN